MPTQLATEYATITCPHCGHRAFEPMADNACQYFYTCRGCATLLKPLHGDCCVFCSYADRLCPPRVACLPEIERSFWAGRANGGFMELRLRWNATARWSVELYFNGRFLISQRCDSEREVLTLAEEVRARWDCRSEDAESAAS
jgi:hypothetical protein